MMCNGTEIDGFPFYIRREIIIIIVMRFAIEWMIIEWKKM